MTKEHPLMVPGRGALRDMLIPPELLGLEACMIPFLQFISSQRSSMAASNMPQTPVIDGAEPPLVSSIFDMELCDYDFDPSERREDIQVIAVIPKMQEASELAHNPSWIIIYSGLESKEVSYFEIPTYVILSEGFGYMHKMIGTHLLCKDQLIEKDTPLLRVPNNFGTSYGLGLNVNVAYMGAWEVTDDAFLGTDHLKERLSHPAFYRRKIKVSEDMIPLCLYGTPDEYRIMPGMGEGVAEHGYLIGFRKVMTDSALMDMTETALSSPEHLHDILYEAPEGSEVIDIDVYFSNKGLAAAKRPNSPYAQLMRYRNTDHVKRIVAVYDEVSREGRKISSKFNNLVTRARATSGTYRGIRLSDRHDPVDFITLEITYKYHRKIDKGGKASGRDGAKGVFSKFKKRADSITDEEGYTADLVIDPGGCFNRMNPGQMYEQFIGRGCMVMRDRLKRGELGDGWEATNKLLEFIGDIRPVYAESLRECIQNDHDVNMFLLACEEEIRMFIPPFCESITPAMVLLVSEKWNIKASRVTYTQHYSDGTSKRITTKKPVFIGPKYVFLLGKIPLKDLSTVSAGYISQYNIPTRPNKKLKQQSVIKQTCQRFGEDEICMLTMSVGATLVARLMGINACSPAARDELTTALLTHPKPTQLDRIHMKTTDIIRDNKSISMFRHFLGCIGYNAE